MNYNASFAISAAGMSIERMRVDITALNLANANTVQSPNSPAYRPLRVVARAENTFATAINQGMMLLPQAEIESSNTPPRMVYEPGHPFSDDKGFVTYAGVDVATEMVTMMSAMRSYEANVAAMNAAKTMALKALDIGGV